MRNDHHLNCIEACNACATACDNCATACLHEKDISMLARCIELDLYCADICRTAVAFMSRGEQFIGDICNLCASICDACANECSKHTHMDHCVECAEACRRCADECRKMAAVHASRNKEVASSIH